MRSTLRTLTLIALGSAAGAAQSPGDRCRDPERFAAAASRHKQELADLLESRGIRWMPPPESVSVAAVAALLRERYARYADASIGLLLYGYEEGRLSVWLLTEQGLAACADSVLDRKELAAAAERLRAALGVSALQATRAPRARGIEFADDTGRATIPLDSAIRQVSAILLPSPLAPALRRMTALVIVPALGIGTVPFALLRPFGDSTLLVERSSVAIAASLFDPFQALTSWSDPRGAHGAAVVVGDPAFAHDARYVLPPLPGARSEASRVAALWNTAPLTGRAATRDSVLALLAARRAGVLYLATHGVADADDPLNASFLALAPDVHDDGRWTAKEIQEARLSGVDLAVLSACQTGLGRVHDAGVIGLARAFQLAGVPRVVMSLWSVDDAATADFMVEFMRRTRNASPNAALRETILVMRARHADPRVWAAFVLFGAID